MSPNGQIAKNVFINVFMDTQFYPTKIHQNKHLENGEVVLSDGTEIQGEFEKIYEDGVVVADVLLNGTVKSPYGFKTMYCNGVFASQTMKPTRNRTV